jgi:uncharacterized RDD family membrane protein YckC
MQTYSPSPAAQGQAVAGQTQQPRYGGFWIRLVAYLLDSVVVGIPLGIVLGYIQFDIAFTTDVHDGHPDQWAVTALPIVEAIAVVLVIAYFVFFWSRGATLGMKALKLRLLDARTGDTIGVGRAVLRVVGQSLAASVCYLGLLWVAFDSRKQGWHDKIAKTVVVRR